MTRKKNQKRTSMSSLVTNSLGWTDVKLRHAKGKIAENTVYAKKGTISRMSNQANNCYGLMFLPDIRQCSL